MIKKYIVDRIEGDYAVCECEDGTMVNILLKQLPSGVKESSIINLENNLYRIESEKNIEAIRKKNIDLQNNLFE